MGVTQHFCFRMARRLVVNRKTGDRGNSPSSRDRDSYQKWRDAELRQQFSQHFDFGEVNGKDVLDFGCGEGDLSFFIASLGANSIRGVDLQPELIESAQRRAAAFCGPVIPAFTCCERSDAIDLPEESVDVILCFDVLEHVMDYPAITREWERILRPGGCVLIWWMPWWHPFGAHIESLIPIPWAHALFGDRTLLDTCARIYELPEFEPRLWDLDDNGQKKPNKWKSLSTLPGVNRLTMRTFEETVGQSGLVIDQRHLHGFGGRLARWSRLCLYVPGLREFFTRNVTYRLRKPVPTDVTAGRPAEIATGRATERQEHAPTG